MGALWAPASALLPGIADGEQNGNSALHAEQMSTGVSGRKGPAPGTTTLGV